jgi:hypothetical protein
MLLRTMRRCGSASPEILKAEFRRHARAALELLEQHRSQKLCETSSGSRSSRRLEASGLICRPLRQADQHNPNGKRPQFVTAGAALFNVDDADQPRRSMTVTIRRELGSTITT